VFKKIKRNFYDSELEKAIIVICLFKADLSILLMIFDAVPVKKIDGRLCFLQKTRDEFNGRKKIA
jgi:hypothetical protein